MIARMASAALVLLIVGAGLGGGAAIGAAIAEDVAPRVRHRVRSGIVVIRQAAAELVVMAIAGVLVVASLFVGDGNAQ